MIKYDFIKVLENYQKESDLYNSEITSRKKQKDIGELNPDSSLSKEPYSTVSLLIRKLPEEIRRIAMLRDSFKVKGSIGNGYMPEVPHICIFDREITKSAQWGYYIVYLFHSSSRSVYLSLNQGFTEYRNKYGDKEARIRIRENAFLAERCLRSIDGFKFGPIPWKTKRILADGYKQGSICFKEYKGSNFPNDLEFVDDLRNLIGIYRELKGLVGLSIFQINNLISEAEYQESIQEKDVIELPSGPVLRKETRINNRAVKANVRDPRISTMALMNAKYCCENNYSHKTFINRSGNPFMEAHHFIPLEFQDEFEYNLDVPENILSLCPNCHRAFHHSNSVAKQALIEKFWESRIKGLAYREIFIDLEKLKGYYKIIEERE